MVAPGMSCKYTVRFAPDSLADFEDFLVVETQAPYPLLVPLVARRAPPILTLPRVLDCGSSLVGGLKHTEYLCSNEGLSAGTFCLIPRSQWPASNLRSVVVSSFAEEPPFAISPSVFQLQPGQATVLEVVFLPTAAGRYSQDFTVLCDNCQVKDITVQGEGQTIALELTSVSCDDTLPLAGEARDLTAEHFVRFPSCHPRCAVRRALTIRNNTDLELPFFWRVMRPNLQWLLPGEEPDPACVLRHQAEDRVFHVCPLIGCLGPRQDQQFELTYLPQELKDHHSVCQLVVPDVPQCPTESSEDGAPTIGDVVAMEIEVKGSTEPYRVRLEPCAVVYPGALFTGTAARVNLKLWNDGKSCILFHWEGLSDGHIMEVEPCSGEIEVNACVALDLVVTGGRPGRLVTCLLCRIENGQHSLALPVEVSFKGPTLTLSEPSLDLGLLMPGEESRASVLLTNTSPLEASWSLVWSGSGDLHPQLALEPCGGVLAARSSCPVVVVFRAEACRHFEAVLEVVVEQGAGCYLWVQADVRTPEVCLSSRELVFSEIYRGVPAKGVVSLLNRSPLPAHFTWTTPLQGEQASLCSASFQPPSGTLDPHATVDVTVEFTTHTGSEVMGVTALCSVRGMDLPIVLGFSARARGLCVSYSVPGQSSSSPDGQTDAPPPLLDFGDEVVLKRDEVTLQLAVTNRSAIAAPFRIEAEYFTAQAPASSGPDSQSEKGFRYRRKPLHSVQARRLQEKAHEEFVDGLLSHGKGAVFLARPASGTLAALETRLIEVTAYSDMWGRYRDHLVCEVGDLQPRLIPVQMYVSGCPLYFQMCGQRPADQHQGPPVQFGTHLSGGDTVSRSLRVNNLSPYDIRVDWETYNVDGHNDRQLLDMVVAYGDAFPLKDTDGNELVGGALALPNENVQSLWGRGRTPSSEGTGSSLQSRPGDDKDNSVGEEEEEEHPKRKLFSVYVRPHQGVLADYPYCITPQQTVIPARGSATVHVSFTPLTLSGEPSEATCVGLALGFMSLDSRGAACVPGKLQRGQGLDLQPVRMDLHAAVMPALLLVETDEDDGRLEFDVSADDLLQGASQSQMCVRDFDVSRTLVLKNQLDTALSFRLGTQPPFSVLHPQPRPHTGSSSNPPTSDGRPPLLLQPRHSLKVRVSFHCSPSLLEQTQPEEAPPTAVASASPIGRGSGRQRTLMFRQNLTIRYSNSSIQSVPLSARLSVAVLRLSRDAVDFGLCYVGRTLLEHITLLCHGACSHWRAVVETSEEDAHVFSVTPDHGVLRGPDQTLATRGQQHLEIRFTASEAREFRATVTIQGALIKPSLRLCLWGRGGYDEALASSPVSF